MLSAAKAAGLGSREFDFINELFDRQPDSGIDPVVIVGQADLETGGFTSSYWLNDGNSGGIGIWQSGVVSPFSTQDGRTSAQIHLANMLVRVNPKADLRAFGKATSTSGVPEYFQKVRDLFTQYPQTIKTTADLSRRFGINNRECVWACDDAYASKIDARMQPYLKGATQPVARLTFHKVPFPGYVDKQYMTANKPEGIGWDNLGKRDVLGVVFHRMEGTLEGTNSYFADPSVGALTDYGIATASSDPGEAGYIYQWNDPFGYRSGWASGPVSAPYGDGLLFVNKYGVNAVNKRLVSFEIGGSYADAIDDFTIGEMVKFAAFWFDFLEIPWSDAPYNANTGMSAAFYHQEMTIGTGKVCPGDWFMNYFATFIQKVQAYMRGFQEGTTTAGSTTTAPAPTTTPAPASQYANPAPIKSLAALGQLDADTAHALVIDGHTEFDFVNDAYTIQKATKRYQYADRSAASTGPDLKPGDVVTILWRFKNDKGEPWGVTPYWTRIDLADDVAKRSKDLPS